MENKTVLITGACGTIGSELTSQCLKLGAKRVLCYDRDDSGLFSLGKKLSSDHIELIVGDVRDRQSLERISCRIDYCFHAAALKHVTMLQQYPVEVTMTNVLGTQNVVDFCKSRNVKLINISTDKAAEPSCVMGASKLITEQITTNAHYSSVRFGNVACSRGSVIPVMIDNLLTGTLLTVGHPGTTRFLMSTQDACSLVIKTATLEPAIYILKMRAFLLYDLLCVMKNQIATYLRVKAKWAITDLCQGEKIHEKLAADSELSWLYDLGEMYAIKHEPSNSNLTVPTSEKADKYSRDELELLIINYIEAR